MVLTRNSLEAQLLEQLYESIENLCINCARYLGLEDHSINATILWQDSTELPTSIPAVENDSDDEWHLNAFMLQRRFDGKDTIEIAKELGQELQSAVRQSCEEGNDFFTGKIEFELGNLHVLRGIAQLFDFTYIQKMAETFIQADIGEGATG